MLHIVEGRKQCIRAFVGKFARQTLGIHARDLARTANAVIARIKTCLHAHDAHTRLVVAIQNGALDGGRAAILRQKRRVHVQATMLRNIEHSLRQNHAVRGDANNIWVESAKAFDFSFVAKRAGFEHRNVRAKSDFLHRRRHELLATAAHRIGARVHGDDVVLFLQLDKNARRKIGGSHEHNAHGITAFRKCLLVDARVTRLGACCSRNLVIAQRLETRSGRSAFKQRFAVQMIDFML